VIYRDEKVLAAFRGAGKCALCGTWSPQREAHHVHSRGAGRLDLPINLISLGGAWSCSCHYQAQRYLTARVRVIEAVAYREGLDAEFLARQVPWMRRQPKECGPCPLCLGACSIRVERGWGFRRHPCCETGVVLKATGEPWHEPERKPTWQA
jgi:hypothetical protein